jgi:hypothetical protein
MSVPPGTIPFNHTRPTPIRAEDPNTRLQEGQYETSVPTLRDRVAQMALKLVEHHCRAVRVDRYRR